MKSFWDQNREGADRPSIRFSGCFNQLLQRYLAAVVPPGLRVLDVGCESGDRLAALHPNRGVGIDSNPSWVALAQARHPHLEFRVAEPPDLAGLERFDYVVLAKAIQRVADVQLLMEQLRGLVHSKSRLVVSVFNPLWRPWMSILSGNRRMREDGALSWFSSSDLQHLLHLAGWEGIRTEKKMLWPLPTPGLTALLNRWIAPLPLIQHLCLVTILTARLRPTRVHRRERTCSVLIPARNEAGNIELAVRRLPSLGRSTEIIFIEGHSQDSTWAEIQRVIAANPHRRILGFQQSGLGKGAAVREGCARATGDLLFILDADLTVGPEELTKFYEVVSTGVADVANGVRLVYPVSRSAMRFLNLFANHLFGLIFTWLLGQRIRDTLCGTKVLFRSDYLAIAQLRPSFGELDPFGDFDLLLGAAKRNLRLVDLPVRYSARSYGRSNIRRWTHGWLLLRMAWLGARRLKFL